MSKQGISINNYEQYQYSICIERNQSYYIEYYDSYGDGWDSDPGRWRSNALCLHED